LAPTREFLEVKGLAGQVERDDIKAQVHNEKVGFKCLHYAVTEASPTVDVVVVKKATGQEIEFAIRTVQDTAKEGADFTALNKVVQMKKHETEKTFSIAIVDNDAWQPDLEFFVELYEPSTTAEPPRLAGDDTITRITILDEDAPGTICLEETQLEFPRTATEAEIVVCRADGADGVVSCTVRTEACGTTEGLGVEGAIAGVHYEPITSTKLRFGHGETQKTLRVKILTWED
jgi:hypothetical protein